MAVAAACTPRLAPLVPEPLAPAESTRAAARAAATLPRRPVAMQFRWSYRDDRVTYAGRGMARLAPPDSLRVDYRGPFGLGAGAAVVLGDSVAWAEPRGDFDALMPAIPLLWVAFGSVQPPAPDAQVFDGHEAGRDGQREVWRFVQGGDRDTLDYVWTTGRGRVLEAEWRRGGSVRARGHTELDAQGAAVRARIDFPEASARFELTITARDTLAVIPPGLWRRR